MSNEFSILLPALHDGQLQVAEHPARFRVLCAGRRWGKDVLEIDRVVDAVARGYPVGWGAPTYKNLSEDWRELIDILAPITRSKNEQDRRIETVTNGVIEMWSLDSPEPIRGRMYKRFILNEAAATPYLLETWRKIIRPTLIDMHGDALFGSTPRGMNDYHALYTMGLGEDPEWASFHFTSFDNPFIDPEELAGMRKDMTERDYRQEILAEFIESEGAVFRNIEAVCRAPGATPNDHVGHTIVGGVDWAREQDYTVMALFCVNCRREVAIDRFNQVDYHQQVGRLEHLFKTWHVKRFKVELNSIGQPVFEMVVRSGIPAVGFNTTLQSKAVLIDAFALALERGDILLLPDEIGKAELQSYARTTTKTGASSYSAPEGMHDDTVIARALGYQLMQETAPIDTVRIERSRREWKNMRKIL